MAWRGTKDRGLVIPGCRGRARWGLAGVMAIGGLASLGSVDT